jgi:hypothetical protein
VNVQKRDFAFNKIFICWPLSQTGIELISHLSRSSINKISYHFIHANPSLVFENNHCLGIFVKTVIHYMLLAVSQHSCPCFKPMNIAKNISLQSLISQLTPFVQDIRLRCSNCLVWCGFISAADISHLLVNDQRNFPSLSIDLHVYSRNQQIRLYDCVKFESNYPLKTCEQYRFISPMLLSYGDIARKSLITNVSERQLPIIKLASDRRGLSCSKQPSPSNENESNQSVDLFEYPGSSLIASYLSDQRQSIQIKGEKIKMQVAFDSTKYSAFINRLINTDVAHLGFIHTIVNGKIRSSKIFYNISGDYRYCPKKRCSSSPKLCGICD